MIAATAFERGFRCASRFDDLSETEANRQIRYFEEWVIRAKKNGYNPDRVEHTEGFIAGLKRRSYATAAEMLKAARHRILERQGGAD